MNEHYGAGNSSQPVLGFNTGYAPVPGGYAPHGDYNNPMIAPPNYSSVVNNAIQQYPRDATSLILEGRNPPPAQFNQPAGQQPVITSQPGGWMSKPQGMLNCPSGLEYLAFVDKLSIYQQFDGENKLTRCNNKYTIQNGLGEMVYMAVEDSNWCARDCECCPSCPFEMKIMDSVGNEVFHLNRPLRCECCCCPCCLQVIEVSLPSGTLLGTLNQNWAIINPNLSINNEAGETVLKIKGHRNSTDGLKFDIKSLDETETIGSISKLSLGLVSYYTEEDGFGLAFPLNLDVQLKAVCLGGVFLLVSVLVFGGIFKIFLVNIQD